MASRRTKTTLPVDDEMNCLSDDKLQFEVAAPIGSQNVSNRDEP